MTTAQSMTISGNSIQPVTIECRLSNGLPQTVLVGLAGRTVSEAKDRLRAAFASCHLVWPKRRVTLNLLPADLPKNDSGLDLGLAAAVLMASGQLTDSSRPSLFLGEIGLDGAVLPVKGLIAKLALASQMHFDKCYLPAEQLKMARALPGLELWPISHLDDLLNPDLQPITNQTQHWRPSQPEAPDLGQVAGQYQAKRALEIAAAGQHHLLMVGPPGGGKTLLARCLAGLLPPLSHQQFLEINQLHGLADTTTVVTAPPVREPHHTIRVNGLLTELNLAHQGVLILNELPEFGHTSLEALRQPLEDHYIVQASQTRPADSSVVATANPCPCGLLGSDHDCSCTPLEVRRYQRRLSGPLLDRFDLFVSVNQPANQSVLATDAVETSAVVKRRVTAARQIQLDRAHCLNGRLSDPALRRQLQLTPAARQLMNQAADRLGLSSRGVNRCLRVARTIADLATSPTTEVLHLAEALQFRPPSLLAAVGDEP